MEIVQAEPPVNYAGFWLRLVATLLDGLALFIPLCAVAFIAVFASKLASATKGRDASTLIIFVLPLALTIATWFYFAAMESSSWQGTLGKRMLGLYVTDLVGQRVTLGRATGRTLAKYLSGMTVGIGYLLCGFTKKRQALHDMLSNCLVLHRPR